MNRNQVNDIFNEDSKRNRTIIIKAIVISIVFILSLLSFMAYVNKNKVEYIKYRENSKMNYNVHLKQNEFYRINTIQEDNQYISELIDYINVQFAHNLSVEKTDFRYTYSYYVEANAIVKDKTTSKNIYEYNEVLIPQETITSSEKTAQISGDVPYDVSITPTVNYSYNPTTGILILNNVEADITINRYYSITYTTDGTNAQNQPTKYLHGETVTFLNPTNGNKIFDGWFLNASYTGNAVSNTSGLTGNLNLFAKWSSNSYENAATYIMSLVGNASSTSTDIITLNTPTGATCTNTLAYDGTTDANLRYIGADPCNYVKFNCDASDNCELWRIVGVMNGVDSNPVLKLVKNDNTLSAAWHNKNVNTWESVNLYSTLNNTYLNTFNANVISDYVLNAQWRIGAVDPANTASTSYTNEKQTLSTASYIGIMNVSDYAYATSGTDNSSRNTCITRTLSGTDSGTCYNNDYLFVKVNSTGQNQWTINKNSSGKAVVYITNVGRTQKQNPTSSYYYRPMVYLKSTVKINTEEGTGTSTDPYLLHVDS